jgi:hypothetical protein
MYMSLLAKAAVRRFPISHDVVVTSIDDDPTEIFLAVPRSRPYSASLSTSAGIGVLLP